MFSFLKSEEEKMEPTMMMNCMFPIEIMLNILSHLPIKSLVRFRCVCKSWFQLFTGQDSNPYFTQLHDAQSILANPNPILIHLSAFTGKKLPCNFCFAADYTQIDNPIQFKEPDWYTDELGWYWGDRGVSVRIWGICKGLMCVISGSGECDVLYIWNPITRDNITIPTPPYLADELFIERNRHAVYGFGFCHGSNEYKVVAFIVSSLGQQTSKYDYQCHANVYTLGTNTWRTTQDVLFDVKLSYCPYSRLVNGALHWLVVERVSPFLEKIVSFDLVRERFQEIKLPFISNCYKRFEEVGGMLAILLMDHMQDLQIWVMKYYGVQESWTKQYTIAKSQIPVERGLEPFGIANDGNIMMRCWDVLVLLNPKTNSVRTYKIFAPSDCCPSTYFYRWSLVSPRYITVLKPESDDSDQQIKTEVNSL